MVYKELQRSIVGKGTCQTDDYTQPFSLRIKRIGRQDRDGGEGGPQEDR